MKKVIIFLLLLCFVGAAHADLTYGQAFFEKNKRTMFSTSSNGPLYGFIGEVENLMEVGKLLGTGNVFYVDSNVAREGDGTTWTNAKDTIDEAIGLCTADRGDIILVAQGHKEVEATAATSLFTLDVAGVSIIGISNGGYEATVASGVITLNQRPTFVIDAANATVTISAKHCRVSGLLFVSDIDNVAVGVTVLTTADGSTIDNCVFRDNAANLDMLVMLSIAGSAQNVNIIDNKFITTISAGGNNAILLVGTNNNLVVAGNSAYGKFATGCLLGSAAAQVNAKIVNNTFVNAEGDAALTLHTSSTGILSGNFLGGLTTIASTLVGDDAMWCFENYVSGDVANSGLLDPGEDGD